MESYLKKKTVLIESLGDKELVIQELSAKAHGEIMESQDDQMHCCFIMVKHCVRDWKDETYDELKERLTTKIAIEIANKVSELSDFAATAEEVEASADA